MSDFENPYASPQTQSIAETKLIHQNALTDPMFKYLKEAAPWMRFIGILGYIQCGFLASSAITMLVTMGTFSTVWNSIPDMGVFGDIFTTAFSFSLGIVYLILALVYFFPAHFTFLFGAKIRNYIISGRENELEEAFKNNKSLWKFNGILAIILLSLVPVLIIVMIIAAVASALF